MKTWDINGDWDLTDCGQVTPNVVIEFVRHWFKPLSEPMLGHQCGLVAFTSQKMVKISTSYEFENCKFAVIAASPRTQWAQQFVLILTLPPQTMQHTRVSGAPSPGSSHVEYWEHTTAACGTGIYVSWWRHQMETFSALLAICAGNSPGPRWIPRTKASDAELWCFLWSASE